MTNAQANPQAPASPNQQKPVPADHIKKPFAGDKTDKKDAKDGSCGCN